MIDRRMPFPYAVGAMAALLLTFLLLMMPRPAWTQAAAETSSGATLAAVSAFSPRMEGSAAEGALLDWIAARASREGWHASPFDFRNSDFGYSFSRCLRVDVPGRSRDTLILVVPVDAAPDSAPTRDGSLGVALAVDLLDRLQGARPPLSMVVLFLGAELGGADPYPMGSTLFLRDYQPDYRTAVLYLDLRAMPRRVLVRGGG
ncbi:MAG TPA: hypothetical protein VL359_15045, partial [bacterium]|nr:hypothetical protein [bacterium]